MDQLSSSGPIRRPSIAPRRLGVVYRVLHAGAFRARCLFTRSFLVTIEELAEIVLEETGASSKLAQYKGEEAFTTRVKTVDFSKSRRDLKHDPRVDIREGVKRYVQWMKKTYLD